MARVARRYRRHQTAGHLKGEVLSLGESGQRRQPALQGRIQNISAGGLCLLTRQVPNVTDPIRSEITVPGTPVGIPTLVQIRWSRKSADKRNHVVGLQFLL